MMKHILLLFSLIIIPCVYCRASLSDEPVHRHVIVALDNAGTSGWISSSQIALGVRNALYNTYSSIGITDSLLRDDDYISIVQFRARKSVNTLKGYYVFNALNHIPVMSKVSDVNAFLGNSFLRTWNMVDLQGGEDYFSLLSVAKPFIIQGVSAIADNAHTSDIRVGRTFLIMITDHHYNGLDFYDEFMQWGRAVNYTAGRKVLDADSISSFCREVEQEYYIRYISTDIVMPGKYVEVYEYQPLQQHFILPSVIQYPAQIEAIRTPRGTYRMGFSIDYQGDSHFSIDRLEFNLADAVGQPIKGSACIVLDKLEGKKEISFEIPRNMQSRVTQVRIRGWVLLNDGFYGFTQLSPTSDAPDFLGRKGLVSYIGIEYEEDAKIFGVAPFPDWLWLYMHDNQQMYALVSSFVLFILVLIAIFLFIRHAQHYHPKASQMKLRQLR